MYVRAGKVGGLDLWACTEAETRVIAERMSLDKCMVEVTRGGVEKRD